MKKLLDTRIISVVLISLFLFVKFSSGQVVETSAAIVGETFTDAVQKWVIVIHAGAGGMTKGNLTDQQEQDAMKFLENALNAGSKVLSSGGSSLDAVEAAVKSMEDCPLFNAGEGAVLNADGQVELDAAIMNGATLDAGAVAGVKTLKNPVSAARKVMETTKHVFLAGQGADEFGKKAGLDIVSPDYFITPERQKAFEEWKKEKHGTVGAVALDMKGNLAAATSTGGLMGKMAGRIGDSPVIGAGTYANNQTCAVSATGQGEFFIRNVIAYDLSARMEYQNMPLEEAAQTIIKDKLDKTGGKGGLIAVDKNGNIAMPFNTSAMFRGYIKSGGEKEISVY